MSMMLLPSHGDISVIAKNVFYGTGVLSEPVSFHTSPLADNSWATDAEQFERKKLRSGQIVHTFLVTSSAGGDDNDDLHVSTPATTATSTRSQVLKSVQFYELPPLSTRVDAVLDRTNTHSFPFAPKQCYQKKSCDYSFCIWSDPAAAVPSPNKKIITTHVETPAGMTDEGFLAMKITEFLEGPDINPYGGSLPSERVVTHARTKLTDQYNSVVGDNPEEWENFINRHPDVFKIFYGTRNNKRIRLVKHTGFEDTDDLMKSFRSEKEARVMACLACVLPAYGCSCTLDYFLGCCTDPTLPVYLEEKEKPPRGDLKRLILKQSKTFAFNQNTYTITRIAK